MPRIGVQDRALFNSSEFALIQSSFPAQLKTFSLARVKAQTIRARKHSDKYRKLAREQHRAKKESGKGFAQPASNVRTERKAQIFSETLNRFEKRLEQLLQQEQKKRSKQVKPPRASRPSIRQKDAKGRKKPQPHGRRESAMEARAKRQIQQSRKPAIQGHIRARGKRRQAKRDSR